jgi:hypothetical protein
MHTFSYTSASTFTRSLLQMRIIETNGLFHASTSMFSEGDHDLLHAFRRLGQKIAVEHPHDQREEAGEMLSGRRRCHIGCT